MKVKQLKELVKQVVKEEQDYQQLFKHMLDKTGKDINSMSDDEKKKFFNAVDTAYKAKSEGRLRGYNENLPGNQEKLDTDKDGEIEASDLAALRNKKEENINEARDADGNEYPEMDDVKAAIKKMIQNDAVEKLLKNKVISYLQKEKRFDGAGNTNSMRLYDKAINDLLNN
jgi:hypothetical protein